MQKKIIKIGYFWWLHGLHANLFFVKLLCTHIACEDVQHIILKEFNIS
jgi:hypothetical protein